LRQILHVKFPPKLFTLFFLFLRQIPALSGQAAPLPLKRTFYFIVKIVSSIETARSFFRKFRYFPKVFGPCVMDLKIKD